MIENVIYQDKPPKFEVRRSNYKATIVFPTDVITVETENGEEYIAAKVYYLDTTYTPDLESRVEKNYGAWLESAQKEPTPPVTLGDVVELVDALTDLVIGGFEND